MTALIFFSFSFYKGKLESDQAYLMLVNEPKGTYILRENSRGEPRFSVRSQVDTVQFQGAETGNCVKLVGHITLTKDKNEFGWFTGIGEKQHRYESFYDIIQAHKKKDSIYQFIAHYKR